MSKKNLAVLGAVAMCSVLCSCYNLRTNPNESPDKITFGEACEHYLLGAHDCRRSPKDCNPICREDIKQYSRNAEVEQRKWEAFCRMEPFIPKPTGIRLFDRTNRILAKISAQIKREVVIPYAELAKQGHIEAYKVFRADVEHAMKEFKIDRTAATEKIYAYWLNRYGEERCRQLMAAMPCIEMMRADRQLFLAIDRNERDIKALIRNFDRDVKQLKAAAKTSKGREKIVLAAVQTGIIANQLRVTLAYLGEFCQKESQAERDIKAALARIQKNN